MVEVTLLAVTGMQKRNAISLANRLASRETVADDLLSCLFFRQKKKKSSFNQTFSLPV